jgi:hypothetical protein
MTSLLLCALFLAAPQGQDEVKDEHAGIDLVDAIVVEKKNFEHTKDPARSGSPRPGWACSSTGGSPR